MKMRLMTAALGLAVLAASPAFAQDPADGSSGEGYDLKQTMATDLMQQFDSVAPQHKSDPGYGKAMALRKKAGVNADWERYERATEQLRDALRDIHVYPNM